LTEAEVAPTWLRRMLIARLLVISDLSYNTALL